MNTNASKDELNQLINYNPIATFFLDKDGFVTNWNKSCELLTGVKADDVVGTKDAWKPFYEAERPVLANIILRGGNIEEMDKYYPNMYTKSSFLKEGYEVVSFVTKIKKWIIFSANPILDDSGNVIGAVETIQDITNLKNQEDIIKKYGEMEKMNELMVGRELKMIELKKEIDDLKKTCKL